MILKRLFKKNQIIITALAVMIAIAGYLNYSGRLFGAKEDGAKEASAGTANQELLDISAEDLETDGEIASNDSEVEGTPGEAVLTSGEAENTVAQAKVAREQMRSQNKETLQAIIDNANISEEEKKDAIAQMLQMTQLSEQEVAVETLMASKGFSESVVSLTADSADIVVNAAELTDANRAQIEDIVTRKTNIAPEKIVITPMSDITKEIEKRRTFAIISHPDAGKTTLTEKFLLYGGAINQAGSVKGKATAKHAVSDWMEIEKERGISVTSSVLQFNYGGYCINILDTPGHQDFSEDTYRTLMAADSAVMVIDASKGVEAQTRKLFKVCVMRHIPIFTFINKMDREAKDTFDLLDEIEKELGIATCPVNWPIGSGKEFKGVFDRQKQEVELFSDTKKGTSVGEVKKVDINNPEIDWLIGTEAKVTLEEEIELLDGAAAEFDQELVSKGELSPVFFGSALTNFGVETFLQHFLAMTSSPLPRMSDQGPIDPMKEKDFSAFVFKIQANMNKAHRDRIAFMRICSGEFEAGMNVYHIQGGREVRLSQPQQMMASERKMIDKAYGGDIIGVFDPGIFSIGDTLTTSKERFVYEGIPTFAPEHFARVRQVDTMKRKQFVKGINQIAQEGAIQIFQEYNTGMEEIIVGVVGVLQFDVLKYRLENEYKVEIRLENLPYEYIRWIENEEIDMNRLVGTSDMKKIKDLKDRPLLLFTHEWSIRMTQERNEGLILSEFGRS